jgi:hypothetical protein
VDAGQKISGELIVTCCDGAKVLEFVEEAFDEVALAVEGEIAWQWNCAAGVGRNNRGDSSAGEGFDEGIGVEGLVANQCLRIGVLQQRLCADEKGAFLKTKEPARLGRQQQ